MLERTISIDLGERELKEAAASRRFPCTISSETPVPRRSWDGTWIEVLSHARGAVDLGRSPLPVIEGHDRLKVNIGQVRDLKLDGTRLRGELVLGASQRARELAEDIGSGIVTGLSVGYTIDTEERDEKAKRITARRWTPYEVSIVSVPADVTVGINRGAPMDPQNPGNPTPPPATDPAVAARAATELATRAERERAATIRDLTTRHGLADLGERLVRDGMPLADARTAILNELARRDEQFPIDSHLRVGDEPRITAGEDYREDFQRAAVDALLLRAGIRIEKPHAAARDVDPSVYGIARICLSRAGKSASRMFGGEARGPALLKRAATTSDFPAILEGALHASIRKGWEDEPASHREWVRVAPFVDFREAKRPILSSAPDLEVVLEGGEYKHGYFDDEGTGYTIGKYGKIICLSWEALVNDNLNAFLRVQPALGQSMRRLEADLVYAQFALNSAAGPTMPDTKALFHVDHGNLVASAAFDAAQLGLGRTALRKMKSLAAVRSAGGYMALVPKFLIVPAEKEQAAEVLLANASRRTTSEKATAEWVSSLTLVVEPRLPSTGVFLAADSAQIDTFELGLLEENVAGPHIETEQGFDTDESRWKIRHTAGVKALDHRGLIKMVVT